MSTFTVQINNVDIEVNGNWENDDGEHWKFYVSITVSGSDGRQCDGIRTPKPSMYDIKDSLTYLDKPQWPSDTLPTPQIGNVPASALMDISRRLIDVAKKSAPQCSAKDSYYGN